MFDAGQQQPLPRGRRWGLDVGTVRIGLAQSDPDGLLATPYKTVRRDLKALSDLDFLSTLMVRDEVKVIYVGLPTTLKAQPSASTLMAQDYALALQERGVGTGIEVRLIDERLTSVSAHRQLRLAGVNAKEQRKVVDQVAAAEILELALATERQLGRRAGLEVSATN